VASATLGSLALTDSHGYYFSELCQTASSTNNKSSTNFRLLEAMLPAIAIRRQCLDLPFVKFGACYLVRA